MDTAQWPQEIVVKPMEEMIVAKTCSYAVTTTTTTTTCSNVISNKNNIKKNMSCSSSGLERKVRPEKDQAVNCPRCNSTNTKFCYYNNYSLTQPRYLCKTCKRYWTEGGSLRNIPVGGGSRKNKRSSSSSSLISPSKKLNSQSHHDLTLNPKNMIHDHQGHLNMGFPQTHEEFRSLSEFIPNKTQMPNSASTSSTANHLSAMELLNGLTSSRGLTIPFIETSVPDPNAVYSSGGFPSLQDFKPSLSFSLDGIGIGIGNRYDMSLHLQGGGVQQVQETNNGRLLFPFEDLKHASTNTSTADHHGNNTTYEQTRHHGSSAGYWTGMLDTSEGSW